MSAAQGSRAARDQDPGEDLGAEKGNHPMAKFLPGRGSARIGRRSVLRKAFGLSATLAVTGSMALAAAPAGATPYPQVAPENTIIVGSGSSTTYNMMQQLDLLFNSAPGCPMYVAKGSYVQPLNFQCLTAEQSGDSLGADASPTTTPQNPFGDVAISEPPIGSSNGIKQLEYSTNRSGSQNVANNVNYARSSRPLNPGNTGDFNGLNFVAYAEDQINWFHFTSTPSGGQTITTTNGTNSTTTGGSPQATPSAAIHSVSLNTLKAIYNGTINNWKDVADDTTGAVGADAPIVVFSGQIGSGTRDTMKTHLGFDPSLSSNPVNCATAGSNGVAGSNCAGPAIIFENELAQLTMGSVTALGANGTSFLSSLPVISGTNDHYVNRGSIQVSGALAAGTTKVTLASPAIRDSNYAGGQILGHSNTSVVIKGHTYTVTAYSRPTYTTAGALKAPASITLSTGLTTAVAATAQVRWTNSWDVAGSAGAVSDQEVRADAIFFYSYGKWKAQNGVDGSNAVNSIADVNCAHGCGGATMGDGYAANLGTEGGIPVNDNAVLRQTAPIFRYLFNVYNNGSAANNQAAATPATLNYVSEAGFLCKPQNKTLVNPLTGHTYVTDIQHAIESAGFFPLSAGGLSNGVVDDNYLTDEYNGATVSHGASTMTLSSTTATAAATYDYSQYMNVPSTGLAGGFVGTTNPSGYCLVTTTDGNGRP